MYVIKYRRIDDPTWSVLQEKFADAESASRFAHLFLTPGAYVIEPVDAALEAPVFAPIISLCDFRRKKSDPCQQ